MKMKMLRMYLICDFFKRLFGGKKECVEAQKCPTFIEVPAEHQIVIDEQCLDTIDVPSCVECVEKTDGPVDTCAASVPAAPQKKKKGRPKKKKKTVAE